MKDFLYSYDSVCLRPKYSELPSRSNTDTTVEFLGRKFNLPVIPSNMKDVIDIDIARMLSEKGYFYIMHRFDYINKDFIKLANEENWDLISVSVGTAHYKEELKDALENKWRIDYITIDVAHGHHLAAENTIRWLRQNFPASKIIAGNVATIEGYEYLAIRGADAIKVGIGGGSICTTRFQTGFHLPTLHSIMECEKSDIIDRVPIIADGGAKHFGDIAKALTAGATFVMAGGWFASCIDSPAEMINGKKQYRGSTSHEAKGVKKHIEGR